MKKLAILGMSIALFCITGSVFAAPKNVETETSKPIVQEENYKHDYWHFYNEKMQLIFYAKKETVTEYVTAPSGLNVRELPSLDAPVYKALPYRAKVKVLGEGAGWAMIEIDDYQYFCYSPYLSKKQPKPIEKTSSTGRNTATGSEYAAKEEIARRESGGNYNAVSKSGKYIGRYQLTKSYLKGDYSPANQERVADAYVKNRYGSWQNALAHHNSHGWY